MENLEKLAMQIAESDHRGQFRRDNKTESIEHQRTVVKYLLMYDENISPKIRAVAWLHDTFEDTTETEDSLRQKGMPEDVILSVKILTKTNEDYNAYLEKVKRNPMAKMVKIFDMLSNLSDQPTPKQIKKYIYGLTFLLSGENDLNHSLISSILEKHLSVTDEWGGSKLAEWKYGHSVLVDGIDAATNAIVEILPVRGFSKDLLYLDCYSYSKPLIDGVPCGHPGCLHHAYHPCEGCGRILGSRGLAPKTPYGKNQTNGETK